MKSKMFAVLAYCLLGLPTAGGNTSIAQIKDPAAIEPTQAVIDKAAERLDSLTAIDNLLDKEIKIKLKANAERKQRVNDSIAERNIDSLLKE